MFSNLSIADLAAAVAEGRRQQADYVLRLVLGEFLDAAPMTFRPDYVTLQSADWWSTKNGAVVWSLAVPMVSAGTNLRDYHRLIDELAERVVEGMVTARVDRSGKPFSTICSGAPDAGGASSARLTIDYG